MRRTDQSVRLFASACVCATKAKSVCAQHSPKTERVKGRKVNHTSISMLIVKYVQAA